MLIDRGGNADLIDVKIIEDCHAIQRFYERGKAIIKLFSFHKHCFQEERVKVQKKTEKEQLPISREENREIF